MTHCYSCFREKVREEYDALVQNIFGSAFDIKRKFDEYRFVCVDSLRWMERALCRCYDVVPVIASLLVSPLADSPCLWFAREELHQDIFEQIKETRREALDEMKRRFGSTASNFQDAGMPAC